MSCETRRHFSRSFVLERCRIQPQTDERDWKWSQHLSCTYELCEVFCVFPSTHPVNYNWSNYNFREINSLIFQLEWVPARCRVFHSHESIESCLECCKNKDAKKVQTLWHLKLQKNSSKRLFIMIVRRARTLGLMMYISVNRKSFDMLASCQAMSTRLFSLILIPKSSQFIEYFPLLYDNILTWRAWVLFPPLTVDHQQLVIVDRAKNEDQPCYVKAKKAGECRRL